MPQSEDPKIVYRSLRPSKKALERAPFCYTERMKYSRTGLVLSGAFIAIALFFALTQGIFGESFIMLILGLPWVLIFASFEFFNPESQIAMYAMIFTPIALNAGVLYLIGRFIDR